jgi:tripartite-type tricarboxylate transporter receptor subunit TctC
MVRLEHALAGVALLLLLAHEPPVAAAQGEVSFKGKTITMIIGSEPGGGTDATGRVIAPYLRKYLPGEPDVVTQNVPGANGIAAVNYFVRRTQGDGSSVLMTSNLTVDPLVYRNSGAQYDPKAFPIIGGIGRDGTAIFVTRNAQSRLYDKSKPPIVIGTVVGMPRAAMQPAIWCIEYLGWNARWVAGYHSTNEVMLAFDRGEIDMTSTGNIFQMKDRLSSGYLKIVNQSGALENGKLVGRPEFAGAPMFTDQMKGKVVDPVPLRGLDYWVAISNLDKWLGLPPGTPDNVVEAYRTAFRKASTDKDFLERGEKISDEFAPMAAADVASAVRTLADTPQEAIDYIKGLMRKQGLPAQ